MTSEKLNNDFFTQGRVLREPVGFEKGYWIGCPDVFHDTTDDAIYLTYRIRRPRGVQPERGGEVRISKSTDGGQSFEDIFTMTKDQVNTASIERTAVQRGDDGQWRYFASYVDETDGRWITTVTKAESPDKFDVSQMKPLFKATDYQLEGIKDPWIIRLDGVYHMFLSVAVATKTTSDGSHETLDIYNTGECLSATALATSRDLDHWQWHGLILSPGETGWDCYCRRINSILPIAGKYLAFYDGSASHLENYEERCGLAVSSDLKNWEVLTPEGPQWTSPFATGSLRYADVQVINGKVQFYYEFAREDEAHDLRHVTCDLADFVPLITK